MKNLLKCSCISLILSVFSFAIYVGAKEIKADFSHNNKLSRITDAQLVSTNVFAFPTKYIGEKKNIARQQIFLANYNFDPLFEAPLLNRSFIYREANAVKSEYYLLQFYGPIMETWKQKLSTMGIKFYDYLPEFTYIIKAEPKIIPEVEILDFVRWIGIFQPAYRIAPKVLKRFNELEFLSPEKRLKNETEILVTVFRDEDISDILNDIKSINGTVLGTSKSAWKSKIKARLNILHLPDLAGIQQIKWIEFAPEWKLHNNLSTHDIMGVSDVWDNHGLRGVNQVVCVCDTGLDQGSTNPASLHDDFENGSGSSRVLTIYDRVGDGANDVNSGHGTHVSGSVLGNGSRSGSTPSTHSYPSSCFAGGAPEASLVFQAVEDNSTGSLTGIPDDLNTLFDQARTGGAHIHTNSWGHSAAGMYDSMAENVDEFCWDYKNFTILFSAGNNGTDNNSDGVIDYYNLGSPGVAKNCITVGASENNRPTGGGYNMAWGTAWPIYFPANPINDDHISNNVNGLAAFSSRGSCTDLRYKPDIVAPGTNIISTQSSATSQTGWGSYNSYYCYMGGTSMSTPLVAGTTALIREFYTSSEGITPSSALIKATLLNGPIDISPGQYGTGSTQEIPNPPPPNNVEGWGRVNLENSIFPAFPRTMEYHDVTSGINQGSTQTYNVNITNTSVSLRCTLVWTDYPASSVSAGGLVNDLDIRINDPSEAYHYANNAIQRNTNSLIHYDTVPYWISSLGSNQGYAVKFTPSSYPVTVSQVVGYIYTSGGSYPTNFNINIWDDDGAGGIPGTQLATQTQTIRRGGWWGIDIDSPPTISSGSFYIEFRYSSGGTLNIVYDQANNHGRSWKYTGTWSQPSIQDSCIRAVVYTAPVSTNYDRVNNVEGVDIASPTTGQYTIEVIGSSVPQGSQAYALIISGGLGAVQPTPTPTPYIPTPTQTPIASPTPTPTSPHTPTPPPKPTVPPTPKPTATSIYSPTPTPEGNKTPTPSPTVSPTPITPIPTSTPTAIPSPTPIADYYVDAVNGSDISGDGSIFKPFRTIQYTVNQIYEKDRVVFLFPGTYEERVIVQEIAAGLDIIGAGADVTTIDASGVYKNGGVIHLPSGEGFLIKGLTITGGTYEGSGDYGGAIRAYDSSVTVKNCTIRDNFAWSYGCGGVDLGENSVVQSNIFISNTTKYSPAAVSVGADSVVEWNTFSGNYNQYYNSGAIQSDDESVIVRDNRFINNNGDRYGAFYGKGTVYNNLFIGNRCEDDTLGGGAAYITGGLFVNNTLVGNIGEPTGSYGSGLACGGNVVVKNNIIVDGTNGVGLYVASGSSVSADYNDIWNNDLGSYGGSAVPGTHDIHQNPNFIDESGDNYRLSEGSFCIDVGLNGEVTWGYDLDQNQRIWDGNDDGTAVVDMGAYEYGAPPYAPTPTPVSPPACPWIYDYNGDRTSDIAIFRGSSGLWAVRGVTRVYFGGSADETVPGDYDGDGTTEIGIFRGSSGLWALRGVSRVYFGGSSDFPQSGDYDGDGTTDIGLFRGASGLWSVRGVTRVYFGGSSDEPAPGYYNGDGTKDIGIFRPTSGLWAIRGITRTYFGGSTDETVPGDYNGDGIWEPGIFRPASGLWAIRGVTRVYFGSSSDSPVPADYVGSGADSIGIFRESSGLWAVRGITRAYFGSAGDIPVTR